MTTRKTVFILKLGSQVLCVRTNLLHTYKHLLSITNLAVQAKFPCYNTFNNKLRAVGSSMELITPMGTFSLEHHPLLIKQEA